MFRLAVCILLGLVTTWFVAAALGAFGPISSSTYTPTVYRATLPPKDDVVSGSLGRSFGTITYSFSWPMTYHVVNGRPILTRRIATGGGLGDHPSLWDIPKGWGLAANDYKQRIFGYDTSITQETATGWPLPAFWFAWDKSPASATITGGFDPPILNPPPPPGRGSTHHAIPYRPVALGLIVDTIAWAALWSVLFFGVPLLRARRRRIRGLCPRCGYDLKSKTDITCPECGTEPSA